MNEQVIEKLQKILALANCKGATQGEMEAAMARAKEIAIRHGIELAALPARAESKSKLGVDVKAHKPEGLKTSTRYEHPYHNWVMKSLERVFGVRFLFARGRIGCHPYLTNMWIVGTETDVALTTALFPWLEDLFPKLFWKAVRAGTTDKSFACQNGFYMGLCSGIAEANKREEAKLNPEDRSQWALVVRSKEDAVAQCLAELFPKKDSDEDTKAQKPKKDRKSYDPDAYYNGKAKGEQINLNQLDATKARSALPQS